MGGQPAASTATGFAQGQQPPMTRQQVIDHDINFVYKHGFSDAIDPNYGTVGYKTHVTSHAAMRKLAVGAQAT